MNDATGVGGEDGDDDEEDDDDDDDGEEAVSVSNSNLQDTMRAGSGLLTRFESQGGQEDDSEDEDSSDEVAIRKKHFKHVASSMWAMKKIEKHTQEVETMLKKHESTKKELVAPAKALLKKYPDKKEALTVLLGLLEQACVDGEVRQVFIESVKVFHEQVCLSPYSIS